MNPDSIFPCGVDPGQRLSWFEILSGSECSGCSKHHDFPENGTQCILVAESINL